MIKRDRDKGGGLRIIAVFNLITSKQCCAKLEGLGICFKARVFSDVRRRDWSHSCLFISSPCRCHIALLAYALHVAPIFQHEVAGFSLSLQGLDSVAWE